MSQKREQILLEQKMDILKRYKPGEKAVEIGRSLGLPSTTVRSICTRDADKIKKFAECASLLQHKQVIKMRSSLMEKMESLLSVWIEDQNQRRMPLSQMVIQKKALSLFNDLKENYPLSSAEIFEEFEASRGWFDPFKNRANLHNIALKGEVASADNAAADKFKLELKAIIEEGYSAKQVFNAKSSPGYKVSKDRLTLLLGGNAADMEEINDVPSICKEQQEMLILKVWKKKT
ncbi:tigger transposable element-derived protein 1-like [Stomoxys calcitrans]|uniref:tigger transposable element-derived protein 1-like n=1 Tax=Stomoxys calcitrans TaxID=35570 RepID=UPI0027E3685A|nr:tigger transposable element-derived protein 1-like [Stomoxys calcitrans]